MRLPLAALTALAALCCATSPLVAQQQPQIVGDLAPLSPRTLTPEELRQLIPGAKMSRVSQRGNTNRWTNEPDGSFVISTDNRNTSGVSVMAQRSNTAPGKWHISDDGRYCVLIEWKSVDTEEWCRYLIQTTDGYYAAKSDKTSTEKVYKLEINK
jgi:hypothetical protein